MAVRDPKPCEGCGELFTPKYAKNKYCGRSCWLRKYNAEDREHTMKGAALGSKASGDKLRGTGKGYVKRNGRHEHRTVAEEMLGRPLVKGEIVHHGDEVKSNNDPTNLHVMTQGEHIRIHVKDMLKVRKERHGY